MSPPIMPTRILIVGSGGREHALAWKLANEPGVNRVVVAPGSDGIALEARVACVRDVDPLDAEALIALARREAVELVVIGPEAPLAAGVVDALTAAGVPTFGPTAAAARIESSKAFCREVAEAAGVPMARGAVFTERASARAFARSLDAEGAGIVVKADGLAGGKGVTVCENLADAERAIDALFAAPGDDGNDEVRVVVEERLTGPEASLIAIADGRVAVALPPARDHKRLLEDDRGPNTGGMGAYSPLPDLPDAAAADLLARFQLPILAELSRRGTPFRGALYAGLILTAAGPRLLECNARFGDPETQAVLPRLAGALGPVLLAAAQGRLARQRDRPGTSAMPTTGQATVAVVLAAAGYPRTPRRGDLIEGLDPPDPHALVFHAGTRRGEDGRWRTDGGRVLAVVGRGPDLESARSLAERAGAAIRFEGAQRRRDIAAVPATVGAGS
jgi:phosphoribosylamine--glycine ligase